MIKFLTCVQKRTVTYEGTGYTPFELVYSKNLPRLEELLMECWFEPNEENNLVVECVFQLIKRLKRCIEVSFDRVEELQVKRKTV